MLGRTGVGCSLADGAFTDRQNGRPKSVPLLPGNPSRDRDVWLVLSFGSVLPGPLECSTTH